MRVRSPLRLVLLAAAICASLAAQTKRPVTISDVIREPAASEISPIWSPGGEAFAYKQDDKVHLYKVADRKSSLWFETAGLEKAAKTSNRAQPFGWQNRRVLTSSYQWFPNGEDMLASAGGELFVIHADGTHDQITHGAAAEDPKLSPDGNRVLYRKDGNLWVLNLRARKTLQLTSDGSATLLNGQLDWVYPEELGIETASWWSPDSKQIAYLQFDVSREFIYPQIDLVGERAISEPERYPQAGTPNALVKLGVASADGGPTRWMQVGDTTNALLARVEWLPNSSAIAAERFTRVQDRLDLLLCDPATGAAKIVLQEKSKTWINLPRVNLRFLKSRPEFLWVSERTGFEHLYRYSLEGKALGQLTSGSWEVLNLTAIDEQHGAVYYTSSEASPLESQLYRVPLEGGPPQRVTPEAGTHIVSASLKGDVYLDTYSELTQPPQTTLRKFSGEQISVVRAANRKEFDELDLLPVEAVEFKAPDGIALHAHMIKPAGFDGNTKYPVIVFVYGGPGVQAVKNVWRGVTMEQVYAHRGYVVWQLDNRGTSGRGHAFEECIYRDLGKQEIADQRLGVEHLIRMGFADPERIGITGWSYGGYMTIRSLLLAPDVFKVGVAGAPVTDWHNYDTIYTERYLGLPGDNKQSYNASSNVKNAAKLEGKLLIIHNIEDDNVLFQNTVQMVTALEKAGKQYFLQLYPQKTHGVSGPIRKSMYEAMADFFDQNLKRR